jgi:hypothetical protein
VIPVSVVIELAKAAIDVFAKLAESHGNEHAHAVLAAVREGRITVHDEVRPVGPYVAPAPTDVGDDPYPEPVPPTERNL